MNTESNSCLVPRRVWVMMILLPLAAVLLLIYYWITQPGKERMASIKIDLPSYPETTTQEEPRDDLTRIKGIGPKIAGVLKNSGCYSYTQLALLKEEELRDVLQDGGIRISNYSSWSHQARLASLGQWEELQELQASL